MWDFVRECLPACAAIKALMGQVKSLRDLRCCGDEDALFVNDTTHLKPITPREEKLVVSYLFFHSVAWTSRTISLQPMRILTPDLDDVKSYRLLVPTGQLKCAQVLATRNIHTHLADGDH